MRPVDLLVIPYDSGRRGARMGAGPIALVEGGIEAALRSTGSDVRVTWIESAAEEPLSSAVEHAMQVAVAVRRARDEGRFSVVLSGNCISTVGAFAGARGTATGLAWFDAHADLNTPATSPSGFLDGMAAATLLGLCHTDAFAAVPGYYPMEACHLLLVGGRSFDPAEADAIDNGTVALLSTAEARVDDGRTGRLRALTDPLRDVYLHLDLDVLDPDMCGPANEFATAGGLHPDDIIRIVQDIVGLVPLAGVTLSAYDPAMDAHGAVRDAALRLILAVVEASSSELPPRQMH